MADFDTFTPLWTHGGPANLRGAPITPSCAGCRFWAQFDGYGNNGHQCRRHAPSKGAEWPSTNHWDWCGDYLPKMEVEGAAWNAAKWEVAA